MGFFDSLFGGGKEGGIFNPGKPKVGTPPAEQGEYRLLGGKYIGISNNMLRRIKEHLRSGKITKGDTISYQTTKPGVSFDDLRKHEAKKINKHKPELNKRTGGGGRPPKVKSSWFPW
ncbi:hypothetical protein AGMMS49959_04790 [Planctomycetales bacterium]|nr:hypothetical protein AGMMS49959_04790 [Planctomycetales bacterium]